MRAVILNAGFPDLSLEREVLTEGGFRVEEATCSDEEEMVEALGGATAVLIDLAPMPGPVVEALEGLRIISRYGVGVDNVDLEAARRRGVWVANVPDYGTEEVAVHAASQALALVRHLPFHDRAVRAGRWHYLETGTMPRPSRLVLGVVGMGRIGRELAGRLGPWFARVVGYDPFLPAAGWPAEVERADHLAELFGATNLVSLHLPLTPETEGMVGRELLERMPRPGYLVNTARGGLVALDDLAALLDEGRLAGAALDVLPEEPPPPDHPLLRHPRLLLTPHVGWYSVESERELRTKAARNVVAWAETGRPLYPVAGPEDPGR